MTGLHIKQFIRLKEAYELTRATIFPALIKVINLPYEEKRFEAISKQSNQLRLVKTLNTPKEFLETLNNSLPQNIKISDFIITLVAINKKRVSEYKKAQAILPEEHIDKDNVADITFTVTKTNKGYTLKIQLKLLKILVESSEYLETALYHECIHLEQQINQLKNDFINQVEVPTETGEYYNHSDEIGAYARDAAFSVFKNIKKAFNPNIESVEDFLSMFQQEWLTQVKELESIQKMLPNLTIKNRNELFKQIYKELKTLFLELEAQA